MTETGKNHYMDNFYTDPHFFLELSGKKNLHVELYAKKENSFLKIWLSAHNCKMKWFMETICGEPIGD